MPATHTVQSVTFDPDTIDGFIGALRTIGFTVTEKQTLIDGIHYTHHAKWMSTPFDDGIYFKYYDSQYTPKYTYTYTAEQTYSGTTYDENQINEWRELYPDTFEILNVEDHTSSSFILYRLSKDNRDYENYLINWTPSELTSVIIGTQGDDPFATRFRINSALGYLLWTSSSDPTSDVHKIPYVKTSDGGIIVQSLTYIESGGSARSYNIHSLAFLPPSNNKDQWTSMFYYNHGNQARAYTTHYIGTEIYQAGYAVYTNQISELTLLQPLEYLDIIIAHEPPPAQGHFYNGNTFINNHYKIDNKIFNMSYGPQFSNSMGEIFKDVDNNEFYRFNSVYAIKL